MADGRWGKNGGLLSPIAHRKSAILHTTLYGRSLFKACDPSDAVQPMKRLIVVVLATAGCVAPLKLAKDDSPVVLSHHLITAPDPSQRGTHVIRTLYYGSGTDKNRPVFKDSVTIKTA